VFRRSWWERCGEEKLLGEQTWGLKITGGFGLGAGAGKNLNIIPYVCISLSTLWPGDELYHTP
jgi:hypothetical protein